MLLISWNVASVRARLSVLTKLLQEQQPDIVFLQEIKAQEDNFPYADFDLLGYNSFIHGQKGYNGVAFLVKKNLIVTDITTHFPNEPYLEKPQARFIQITVQSTKYICVYVPNGNPPLKDPLNTSNLEYKLNWFQAFNSYLNMIKNDSFILAGDFNVIEKETDVYNPTLFKDTALMLPAVQEAFHLMHQDLQNPIRDFHPIPHYYSFWDFQGFAWQKNNGILLDYFFLSQNYSAKIQDAGVLKEVRSLEKTSDHAPIFLKL